MPTPIPSVTGASTLSTSGSSAAREASVHTGAATSAQFAHELANLLDGSMRNVALVRSLLDASDSPALAACDVAANEDLLLRLQTAEQGMKQMATLIKRWMHESGQPAATLHRRGVTLQQAIDQAHELHRPAASALGIEIRTQVSDEAALLSAGAVTPVLANAIRNSIEAISDDENRQQAGVIEVRAEVRGGEVKLTIVDNGPGLARSVVDFAGIFAFGLSTKPGGHGHGLVLCKEIAGQLGGTLRVSNRDRTRGAMVTMTYPVRKPESSKA